MQSNVSTPTLLALQLPEIMGLIAKHLPKGTIYNCLQVPRSWHSMFMPYIWRKFLISAYKPHGVPLNSLRDHAHLIHELEFHGPVPTSYYSVECTQLEFLAFSGTRGDWNIKKFRGRDWENEKQDRKDIDPIIRLVRTNPGLKTLVIYGLDPLPSAKFWEAICRMKKLERFVVCRIAIPSDYTDVFWKAISTHRSSLRLDIEFLDRNDEGDTDISGGESSTETFEESIDPNLDPENKPLLQTTPIVPLVNSSSPCRFNFTNLKKLFLVVPDSGLEDKSMDMLTKHFATVKELNMSSCRQVCSWMIQAILSSFPMLESFTADKISVDDIMAGNPWRKATSTMRSKDNNLNNTLVTGNSEFGVEGTDPSQDINSATNARDVEDITAAGVENHELTNSTEATSSEHRVRTIVAAEIKEPGREVQAMTVASSSGIASGKEIKELAVDYDVSTLNIDSLAITEVEKSRVILETGDDRETIQLSIDASNNLNADLTNEDEPIWESVEEGEEEEKEDEEEYQTSEVYKLKQLAVFNCLSTLSQIQVLNINRIYTSGPAQSEVNVGIRAVPVVLDLRLRNGLDKLKTLKNLQCFYFAGPQKMGRDDVSWMLEHWPKLTHISGAFHRKNDELRKLFVSHNIPVDAW
ncbi:hypothetical protein BGZ80_000195 [Entomortierella chlamydospora]|uniref:F-box domain-containing protein n=1 Tax=Entomortierella chlamydospora TaxID=101097 RepID=A0A9P6MTD5_9FUNG|nr:hypothetical protein BGZ80_000195 [Entomortierella chlamydospora]